MRGFRISFRFICGVIILFALGGSLFVISQENYKQRRILSSLNEKITAEEEKILMLESEWSYLNRPERIESLVMKLDQEKPATQLASVSVVKDMPEIALIFPPPRKPVVNAARSPLPYNANIVALAAKETTP